MASPHNQKLFEEAQEWIETVVGEPFRGENFADSLKDGVLLCKLANKIRPFSVKYNNPATMPFKKMENISNFLKAIRSFGMLEMEMFSTPDLYDEKNLIQVVTAIHALGRLMQTPEYEHLPFPKLGVKVVAKNERQFSEEQLAQARAAVSVLNLGSSNLGKKAAQAVLSGDGFDLAVASPSRSSSNPNTPSNAVASPSQSIINTESKSSEAVPSTPTSDLPPDWTQVKSPDGSLFYYNTKTGESTWTLPGSDAKLTPPTDAAPLSSETASLSTATAASVSSNSTIDEKLPPGWITAEADGKRYYFNEATGESSWFPPDKDGKIQPTNVVVQGSEAEGLPPGWEAAKTAEGNIYYFNATLGTSSWTKPTA